MTTAPDPIARARTLLAAAATVEPDLCAVYLASARAALAEAAEEIRQIDLLLSAHEAEFARSAPPAQATLPHGGPHGSP